MTEMIEIPSVVVYMLAFFASFLCLTSFVAIYRTKKTPYPSKLLALGLLVYDFLFLATSSAAKVFTFEDSYIFITFCRGLQMAALIIVSSMALERVFVLNWPYIYMRVASKRNARKVCIGIIILGFLQYVLIRMLLCKTEGYSASCARSMGTYFACLFVALLGISVASYVKIFRIIRNKSGKMTNLKQYKGTVASLAFLINIAVSLGSYLVLTAVLAVMVAAKGEVPPQLPKLADFVYLLNCIVDPLIYFLWFKEARMEIMKLFSHVCPNLKPSVERMRVEIFNICVILESETPSAPHGQRQ